MDFLDILLKPSATPLLNPSAWPLPARRRLEYLGSEIVSRNHKGKPFRPLRPARGRKIAKPNSYLLYLTRPIVAGKYSGSDLRRIRALNGVGRPLHERASWQCQDR